MLRSISEFCPKGMQIRSPGGVTLDPHKIVAIEAYGNVSYSRASLVLHTGSETAIVITFYDNVDGSPPDVYGLARNIRVATEPFKDVSEKAA